MKLMKHCMQRRIRAVNRFNEIFLPPEPEPRLHDPERPGGIDPITREFRPGTGYVAWLVADVNKRMADPLTRKEGESILEYTDETEERIDRWIEMLDAAGVFSHGGRRAFPMANQKDKLSTDDVIAIRKLVVNKKMNINDVAPIFNVSRMTIYYIVTGKTWADAGGPISRNWRAPKRRKKR